MSFVDILKRGKKQSQVKSSRSAWARCEYCDEMRPLFAYDDKKGDAWSLCESCTDIFIEEEE